MSVLSLDIWDDIIASFKLIKVVNGYNKNIKTVTDIDRGKAAGFPISECPAVFLSDPTISLEGEQAFAGNKISYPHTMTTQARGLLKSATAQRDIHLFADDMINALLVNIHRGQNNCVVTSISDIKSASYKDFALVDMAVSVYWREKKG